jgi:hypothetical protein
MWMSFGTAWIDGTRSTAEKASQHELFLILEVVVRSPRSPNGSNLSMRSGWTRRPGAQCSIRPSSTEKNAG